VRRRHQPGRVLVDARRGVLRHVTHPQPAAEIVDTEPLQLGERGDLGLELLQGCTRTSAAQILTLEQFEAEVAALAELERFGVYDLGGGLGCVTCRRRRAEHREVRDPAVARRTGTSGTTST